MAVDQERASEPVEEQRNLLIDRVVIRPMRLVEPRRELKWCDGPSP